MVCVRAPYMSCMSYMTSMSSGILHAYTHTFSQDVIHHGKWQNSFHVFIQVEMYPYFIISLTKFIHVVGTLHRSPATTLLNNPWHFNMIRLSHSSVHCYQIVHIGFIYGILFKYIHSVSFKILNKYTVFFFCLLLHDAHNMCCFIRKCL